MSTSDGDPIGTLVWSESVALAAMQVSLMRSDIGARRSGKAVAVKAAVLGDAVAGFRQVAAEDRPDRPDWLTPLVVDMYTQVSAADAIADQGRHLPRMFESGSGRCCCWSTSSCSIRGRRKRPGTPPPTAPP
jgi:hypothetical protein